MDVAAAVPAVALLARAVQHKHRRPAETLLQQHRDAVVVQAVAGRAPRRRSRKRDMLRTRRRP
jgi:hypothetical protein